MNVILLGAPRKNAPCKCCGTPAATNVSLSGPDADKKVSLDLCPACRRMLGQMLIDESDRNQAPSRLVS